MPQSPQLGQVNALFRRTVEFIETETDRLSLQIMDGVPYTVYAQRVAAALASFDIDWETVSAAMLYRLPSIGGALPNDVATFGVIVKSLVDRLQVAGKFEWRAWSECPREMKRVSHKQSDEYQRVLKNAYLIAIGEVGQGETGSRHPDKIAHRRMQDQRQCLIHLLASLLENVWHLDDRRLYVMFLADLVALAQTLVAQSPSISSSQLAFARIALAVYGPLAERVGLYALKSQLEDASFQLLDPDAYKQISQSIAAYEARNEAGIRRVIDETGRELQSHGIQARVAGRAKHVYSIWRKIQAKRITIERVNDIVGIRIVIPWNDERKKLEAERSAALSEYVSLQETLIRIYRTLKAHEDVEEPEEEHLAKRAQYEVLLAQLKGAMGAVHRHHGLIEQYNADIRENEYQAHNICYVALAALFAKWQAATIHYDGNGGRDWILRPKPNGYQSFHTTIYMDDRDKARNELVESGLASYFTYLEALEVKAIEVQIRTEAMDHVAEYGVAAHWKYKESVAETSKVQDDTPTDAIKGAASLHYVVVTPRLDREAAEVLSEHGYTLAIQPLISYWEGGDYSAIGALRRMIERYPEAVALDDWHDLALLLDPFDIYDIDPDDSETDGEIDYFVQARNADWYKDLLYVRGRARLQVRRW